MCMSEHERKRGDICAHCGSTVGPVIGYSFQLSFFTLAIISKYILHCNSQTCMYMSLKHESDEKILHNF